MPHTQCTQPLHQSGSLPRVRYDIQQLSGSSGCGGIRIPSTSLKSAADAAALGAGPASREPKMIFAIGAAAGEAVAIGVPVVAAAASAAMRAASKSGLDAGFRVRGCSPDAEN